MIGSGTIWFRRTGILQWRRNVFTSVPIPPLSLCPFINSWDRLWRCTVGRWQNVTVAYTVACIYSCNSFWVNCISEPLMATSSHHFLGVGSCFHCLQAKAEDSCSSLCSPHQFWFAFTRCISFLPGNNGVFQWLASSYKAKHHQFRTKYISEKTFKNSKQSICRDVLPRKPWQVGQGLVFVSSWMGKYYTLTGDSCSFLQLQGLCCFTPFDPGQTSLSFLLIPVKLQKVYHLHCFSIGGFTVVDPQVHLVLQEASFR